MQDNIDKLLIEMISNSKNKDCSFILNTQEYKVIKNVFLEFFNSNDKIKKEFKSLNLCGYYIGKYIIKFGGFHIPEKIEQLPQLVKIYYRKNFKIKYNNYILYLGVEIQDYIEEDSDCSFEDIYNVYKSLRNCGYIWIDASYSNVKKKNHKTYIIDTDFIYKENEVDFFNQSNLSKELEEKYVNSQ